MITNISIVSVFVTDVDESKRFYTDVLGFEAKDDITLGDGYRWCTVVHPNQPELMVSLAIPGPPHSPELVEAMKRAQAEGGMHGLGLNVDDCQKTYEELSAKGVEFIQPKRCSSSASRRRVAAAGSGRSGVGAVSVSHPRIRSATRSNASSPARRSSASTRCRCSRDTSAIRFLSPILGRSTAAPISASDRTSVSTYKTRLRNPDAVALCPSCTT